MNVPGCVLDIKDGSNADFREFNRYKSQKMLWADDVRNFNIGKEYVLIIFTNTHGK